MQYEQFSFCAIKKAAIELLARTKRIYSILVKQNLIHDTGRDGCRRLRLKCNSFLGAF